MQTGKGQVELGQWAKEKWNLETTPSQSTISDILRQKDIFLAMTDEELDSKRKRKSAHPRMENALAKFVNEMENQGAPASRESLRDQAIAIGKALKITDFEFSDGWLSNFERRFGFKSRAIHGEAGEELMLKEAAAQADQMLSNEPDALLLDVHHDRCGVQGIDLIPDEKPDNIHAAVLVEDLINGTPIDVGMGICYR